MSEQPAPQSSGADNDALGIVALFFALGVFVLYAASTRNFPVIASAVAFCSDAAYGWFPGLASVRVDPRLVGAMLIGFASMPVLIPLALKLSDSCGSAMESKAKRFASRRDKALRKKTGRDDGWIVRPL